MLSSAYLHWKNHWFCHLLWIRYLFLNIGFVLEVLSFGAILSVATGNPAKFAIIYSLGNILTLAAYRSRWCRTGFLIGFKRQIKNMVDMDRRIASFIFIGALVGTLIFALVFPSKILVILFLVIQIPAYIWYCASYIPFARSCIRSCLRKCFKKSMAEESWSHQYIPKKINKSCIDSCNDLQRRCL